MVTCTDISCTRQLTLEFLDQVTLSLRMQIADVANQIASLSNQNLMTKKESVRSSIDSVSMSEDRSGRDSWGWG